MNVPIDISNTILYTDRMILRPWKETDVHDLYEYARIDGVGQMAGWKPHESIEESQQILQMFIDEKKTFALEYQGKVIGSLGIEEYNEEHFPEFKEQKAREIGYVLSKDYWGKGLMPEAVKEVIRYLFEERELDLIFCGHFLWNKQSQRVQEKCGFRHYACDVFETRLGTSEENEVNILTRKEWDEMQMNERSVLHTSAFTKADMTIESKKVRDFISDGVLAYGVMVGRFKFQKERKIVYAVSDRMHIGASDVAMLYQISKDDYQKLLELSSPKKIPVPPVSRKITDSCHGEFLCGESAYGKRNAFTLEDVDPALTETY